MSEKWIATVRFESPTLVLQESCQGSHRECLDLVNRPRPEIDAAAVRVWSQLENKS
jgi:hypothetical protein